MVQSFGDLSFCFSGQKAVAGEGACACHEQPSRCTIERHQDHQPRLSQLLNITGCNDRCALLLRLSASLIQRRPHTPSLHREATNSSGLGKQLADKASTINSTHRTSKGPNLPRHHASKAVHKFRIAPIALLSLLQDTPVHSYSICSTGYTRRCGASATVESQKFPIKFSQM